MIATLLSLLGDWWQPIAGLIAAGFAAVVWRGRKQEGRDEVRAERAIEDAAAERDRAEMDDRARRAGRDANVEWLRRNRRP
jgi:hypothetical protein